MAIDSAWTWGYFFAGGDQAEVRAVFGERTQSCNAYRVDKVVAIQGEPGVNLPAGTPLFRVETAARLPARDTSAKPRLLFQGVPQHLEYTSTAQRDELAQRSRAELPAGQDTVTVVIPIRKSAAWWVLPTDERAAFFKAGSPPSHTTIGADYVERIYRKLYHTRYAVETRDHDFITYFEFQRAHEGDFKKLLAALRDPKQNAEWSYVDREYEIWLTKTT